MNGRTRKEIEDFVAFKAPGLNLTFSENPAFDSVTIRLGMTIEQTKLIGNHASLEQVGSMVIEMLTEVQKAAVTAIGLEDYVRSRQEEILSAVSEAANRAAEQAEE